MVLWKNRFHFWPRLEGNAHDVTFKVPPGGIEFTLPSPKIGIESLPVVDPPWMPEKQIKDMDVTLNQDRHVGYKGNHLHLHSVVKNVVEEIRLEL